jgi:hypothetical protein
LASRGVFLGKPAWQIIANQEELRNQRRRRLLFRHRKIPVRQQEGAGTEEESEGRGHGLLFPKSQRAARRNRALYEITP